MAGLIERVVEEMIKVLEAALPDIYVEDWPDKSESYQFSGDNGVLLVRYDGSQFKGDAMGQTVQDQQLQFAVSIFLHDLSTDAGIYNTLQDVRNTLTGKRFAGCQRTYPVSEGLVKRQGSYWRFDQVFQMQTIYTGAVEQESAPTIQSTTLVEA